MTVPESDTQNEVVVLPLLSTVEALAAPIARTNVVEASCVHFAQA